MTRLVTYYHDVLKSPINFITFSPAFVQALQNKKASEDKKEEEDMALD